MPKDPKDTFAEWKKFQSFLETCPFSIAIYKADGTPEYANGSLNHLWNIDEETSRHLMKNYNLLRDEQLIESGQMDHIRKALEGETVWTPPIRYDLSNTGLTENTNIRVFWVRSVVFPLRTINGEITHLVLMSEDFSERMEFEEQIQNFNQVLQSKVEEEVSLSKAKDAIIAEQSRMSAMGETLANISHHWRQPLNALSWMIQDLEEAYEQGEMNSDYIQSFIRDSGTLIQQMSETINDFRNFLSKSQQDSFPLREILNSEIQEFTSSTEEANFEIRVPPEKKEETRIIGNPEAFKKVLHTILENFSEVLSERKIENGLLQIDISREEDWIKIRFKDNGGGIREKELNRIFDPYYSTKNLKNGTGLSLFMAKLILEKNMEGNLRVENDEKGAIFHMNLRLANHDKE